MVKKLYFPLQIAPQSGMANFLRKKPQSAEQFHPTSPRLPLIEMAFSYAFEYFKILEHDAIIC